MLPHNARAEGPPEEVGRLEDKLSHCSSITEMLAILATELSPHLPAHDRVSIVFRDPNAETMRIYRVLPEHSEPVTELPRVQIEGTMVGKVVLDGEARASDVRRDRVVILGHASRGGIRSSVSVPLRVAGRVVGALNVGSNKAGYCTAEMIAPLEKLAAWIAPSILAADSALAKGTGASATPALRTDLPRTDLPRTDLVGTSPAFLRITSMAKRAAESDAAILLTGETGVGKSALAKAIHGWSPRSAGPFATVQVADLSPSLIESELFGHVRGAFTGATLSHAGRIARAEGGTLFLDEIGEAPLAVQTKLLRIVQERCYERVGGGETVQADVRIIAATSRDLRAQVARGAFREDLFYRLNVVPLALPPLRLRHEDLPVLVSALLHSIAPERPRTLSPQAWERLRSHTWPGNIRELDSVLRRAAILETGSELTLESMEVDSLETEHTHGLSAASSPLANAHLANAHLANAHLANAHLANAHLANAHLAKGAQASWETLDEHQKSYIARVLRHCDGVIEGPNGAASILGLKPSTLRSRMKRLGLSARALRARTHAICNSGEHQS